MCIRDSLKQFQQAAGTNVIYGDICAGNLAPALQQALESFPVSYTHLRAHETVLELVCRLLLEQKTHD